MLRTTAMLAALFLSANPASVESAEDYPTRQFVIELTSTEPGNEYSFRAAVGYGGRLEFIEATTPFRKEFSAASLTMMFQVIDTEGVIRAQLLGEQHGSLTEFGHVAGRSGKITESPWDGLSFGPI